MDSDREAVERFFRLVIDAWATNDGTTVAGLFADDGSLINPFGYPRGRHSPTSPTYQLPAHLVEEARSPRWERRSAAHVRDGLDVGSPGQLVANVSAALLSNS